MCSRKKLFSDRNVIVCVHKVKCCERAFELSNDDDDKLKQAINSLGIRNLINLSHRLISRDRKGGP